MKTVYPNLPACLNSLDAVEAIDYFFAQKLIALYHFAPAQNQNCQMSLDFEVAASESTDLELVFHLFIALHYFVRQGHTCLPLSHISEQSLWQKTNDINLESSLGQALADTQKTGYQFPALAVLKRICETYFSSDSVVDLVVFENQALYIRRYHQYEVEVAQKIQQKSQFTPVSDIALEAAKVTFSQIFTQPDPSETDWQQIAVANALTRSLSIICGGPGTGKTYTVARLLAVLQAAKLAVPSSPDSVQSRPSSGLKILMAAPTGKAAQRLKESIVSAKTQLQTLGLSDAVLAAIPDSASTLHRLLGIRPNSLKLKHDEENPLNCDLLLVDEVSMIDIAMMAKLLRALPESATLVLLGDAKQLPSVETGNVLADLVSDYSATYDKASAQIIKQLSAQSLDVSTENKTSHITFLTKTHRFGGRIGEIAKAVINGQAKTSWQLICQYPLEAPLDTNHNEINYIEQTQLDAFLEAVCRHYFLAIIKAVDVKSAFNALAQFRILVANRRGPFGVESLNLKVELLLSQLSTRVRPNQHYHGRPVMVTENCYTTGLFNGDVGLIWADENKRLAAYFETDGGLIKVSLARLPKVETVYTMTIHKTQGSEFVDVAIICPEQSNQLLSPELIYTGITRAKKKLYLAANADVWFTAIKGRVQRFSGLAKRLNS